MDQAVGRNPAVPQIQLAIVQFRGQRHALVRCEVGLGEPIERIAAKVAEHREQVEVARGDRRRCPVQLAEVRDLQRRRRCDRIGPRDAEPGLPIEIQIVHVQCIRSQDAPRSQLQRIVEVARPVQPFGVDVIPARLTATAVTVRTVSVAQMLRGKHSAATPQTVPQAGTVRALSATAAAIIAATAAVAVAPIAVAAVAIAAVAGRTRFTMAVDASLRRIRIAVAGRRHRNAVARHHRRGLHRHARAGLARRTTGQLDLRRHAGRRCIEGRLHRVRPGHAAPCRGLRYTRWHRSQRHHAAWARSIHHLRRAERGGHERDQEGDGPCDSVIHL